MKIRHHQCFWLFVFNLMHLNVNMLGLRKHSGVHNICILQYQSSCFVLSCHSSVPMPGERSHYGISILTTDERESQVSHSSWRTKASHNKSRLIPGPWAPSTRKTKRWVLLTKASYYSREPHIATLSIKVWPDRGVGLCCFSSLNLRKS